MYNNRPNYAPNEDNDDGYQNKNDGYRKGGIFNKMRTQYNYNDRPYTPRGRGTGNYGGRGGNYRDNNLDDSRMSGYNNYNHSERHERHAGSQGYYNPYYAQRGRGGYFNPNYRQFRGGF